MRAVKTTTFDKTTFNLKHEFSQEIERHIPSKKKTEFLNQAVEHELQRIKEEKNRKKALKELKFFRKIAKSLPKPIMTVQQALDEIREESLNYK